MAEIIEFKPPDASRMLYVHGIPAEYACEDELRQELFGAFTKFGLISGVMIFKSQFKTAMDSERDSTSGSSTPNFQYYAFVSFFSRNAAVKAQNRLQNSLILKGKPVKVRFARPKPRTVVSEDLYLPKCVELANYYLGFNGWSSSLVSMVEEPLQTDVTSTVRYVCTVRVTVHDKVRLVTDGVGVGTAAWNRQEPSSRGSALCLARKQAWNRGLAAAFSRLVLVVLPGGKVHAEVDTTRVSQHDHRDLMAARTLKVNICRDSPLVSSDEDGGNDSALEKENLAVLVELWSA